MMDRDLHFAASTLWEAWHHRRRMAHLSQNLRPQSRHEAYEIQAKLAELSGQSVAGWKIAATSPAGQKHIGVDGPLAGRLLSGRMLENGAAISLSGNLMRVAEAEFAFRFAQDLKPREEPYTLNEVMAAVDSLHTAIEVPDSRYENFTIVGAPQLIADNACADWFILGPPVDSNWRDVELAQHEVEGYRNGERVCRGTGANVLGDPCIGLTWIANELNQLGCGLSAGHVVTTGTCITPIPIAPGDRVRMDFGVFGTIEAQFIDRSG